MKLTRKDLCVWTNDIYIIPTFRIFMNNQIYVSRNFSIEFHWLVFHIKLLWEAESEIEQLKEIERLWERRKKAREQDEL